MMLSSSSLSSLLVILFSGMTAFAHRDSSRVVPVFPRQFGSASLTSDSSAPTPSPILLPNTISSLASCSPATLTWIYDGPDLPMTLTISNIGVAQGPAPSTTSSVVNTFTDRGIAPRAVPSGATTSPGAIQFQISTSVVPSSWSFKWPQVNVSQGWYILTAEISSAQYSASWSPFFVREIGDTSCLSSQSSSSSFSAPMSTSLTATSASAFSPSPTVIPPPSASSSDLNTGALIGGLIGGIVVLVAVIGLYLYLVQSKRRGLHSRSISSPVRGSSTGGFGRKGWGGLGSVDSHHGTSLRHAQGYKPKPYANERHHSQAESMGPIIPRGPGSDDDIHSYRTRSAFSPSEEKFKSPIVEGEHVGLATLPYKNGSSHFPSRKREPSLTSSTVLDGFSGGPKSASVTAFGMAANLRKSSLKSMSSSRRPSLESSPVFSGSPAMSGSPFTPSPSPLPSSPPASIPPFSQTSYAMAPQMDRSSSNSSAQKQLPRRTPRKPVPAYDLADVQPPTLPPTAASSSTAVLSPSAVSPFADAPSSKSSSSRRGSGHYGGRNKNKTRDDDDGEIVLQHKSSFGPGGIEGKPLHYLVPDMPPPQSLG